MERDRAGLRRLNSYEFENTLRDLLDVPWAQIKNKLPQDGEAFRFNEVGGALDVSHIQMARYMSSADYVMREAMASKLFQPPTATTRYYARDEPFLARNFRPREGNTRTDRINFPVLDSHYLKADNLLGQDGEGTIDGSHPTDLGFERQAREFQKALSSILK